MGYELINTLSESTIFRTRSSLHQFSKEQNANLLYLYVMAIFACSRYKETASDTNKYISTTITFRNFDHFRVSQTDLYMLAHLMKDNKYFNQLEFIRFLSFVESRKSYDFYYYMNTLATQIQVKNPIYMNIKRSLGTWSSESDTNKQYTIHVLYRELYYISTVAEVLKPLSVIKKILA